MEIYSPASHPSRVRGLKHGPLFVYFNTLESHPSRVRGLKLDKTYAKKRHILSHPSRVRGLKLEFFQFLTDAITSRTPRGCVD